MCSNPHELNVAEYFSIKNVILDYLEPRGFECYPFKVGWYNELVDQRFCLPYTADTLAFVVLSTPAMFETTFIPFLLSSQVVPCEGDALDVCMQVTFKGMTSAGTLPPLSVIHDFELHPNRRPKVLMQTAGHVAGAAFFYRPEDLNPDLLIPGSKWMGVSVHPRYGGWFAFRTVLVCPSCVYRELTRMSPIDVVPREEDRAKLLRDFNEDWMTAAYRDCIPVQQRYSELQTMYFRAPPDIRKDILNCIKDMPDSANSEPVT